MNKITALVAVDYTSPNAKKGFVRSLRETGFGVLKNHPLSQNQVQGIYEQWRTFFSEERKNERALATDCLAMVRAIGDQGAAVDREAATQDLNLVLEVKGFGHVKRRNWQQVEQRWQEARQRWSV